MYSAEDGLPGDFHLVHYGARGMGGAGLLFTEMTCVSPEARITPGCTGLWNDAQEAAWTRIVGFVHAPRRGRAIALQLGHAGRKGATQADVGGHGPAAAAGAALAHRSPPAPSPTSRTARCRAR